MANSERRKGGSDRRQRGEDQRQGGADRREGRNDPRKGGSDRRQNGGDRRKGGSDQRRGGKNRRGCIGRIRPASWDTPTKEGAQGLVCAKCGTEISIPPAVEPLKGLDPPGTEAICPKCRGPIEVRKKDRTGG